MRDLLFKNLTSDDRRKRVIVSSEVTDKQGVHSEVRRHFICLIKQVKAKVPKQEARSVYVLKERNTKEERDRFACRIKGSMYAVSGNRLYYILFMHSLRITLTKATPKVIENKSHLDKGLNTSYT